MSEGKISIDYASGKMQFSEDEMPGLAKRFETTDPVSAAARDAALRLSALAFEYFDYSEDSHKALQSAQTRLKFQNEVQNALADPDKGMKTVEYLQDLQPNKLTDNTRFWKDAPSDNLAGKSWTYLPDLVVNLDQSGQIEQICFKYKASINKAVASPYSAICGDRKN